MKNKSNHLSNNNVQLFYEYIVVIEEKLFADINLADGAIFPMAFIKHAELRFKNLKPT